MNEREWLACADVELMLQHLRGTASDRKLRLLLCACCRCSWDRLWDERSRAAVEVAERYADGSASNEERLATTVAARRVDGVISQDRYWWETARMAWGCGCGRAARGLWALTGRRQGKVPQECDLLRCIFGNPFRPVVLDPLWRTSIVIALATAAYENRTLPAGTLEADRLAVLADALEDAGCTDTEILSHLRSPGPHVRGCWPLDLLMGKS